MAELPPPNPCTGRFICKRPRAVIHSIADRETLPQMRRPLDLVGERNGVVGEGDPAFPVRRGQELVGSEPELSVPLPLHEECRWRDESPVQLLFLPELVEKGRARLRLSLVLSGKTGGVTSFTPGATSRLPAPPTTR